jgi:integrase
MRSQPTGTAALSHSKRRIRRRGRADLAVAPDPVLELALEREGDARARARLAAATAAGSPLVTPDGRKRSPVTLPEYRLGRAPANKGRRFPAEVLTGEEVTALLDAYPARTAFGARQRALIVIMWRAGLRIAEALALLPKDVDLERGVIVVLRGKGAKRRTVAIDQQALTYLREWSQQRAALGVKDTAPLFCTIGRVAGGLGRPMNSSSVRESLKSYAKRAGISKRVHAHGLRHTHAYELATEGIPVPLIQRQLGHQALEMTAHYIDHLAPQDVLSALRDRQWPGGAARPPVTRSATSQGAPAVSTGGAADTAAARLTGDRPLSGARSEPRGQATVGVTKSEILRLIAANGGRATQRQLARALRISLAATHIHCRELAAAGRVVRSGTSGLPPSNVWALPPLKAAYEMQPHVKVGQTAQRGHGPKRVLEAIADAGGRASQAQLAGALGVTPNTIAKHCQLLEARGELQRGGLDKHTSNRGSQVWALPGRERWTSGGGTLRLPSTSSSTRPGRT